MSVATDMRGCGKRKKGGVYGETELSPFGRPVEEYLIDPPQVIDPDEFGLTAVGPKLIEFEDGRTLIMDWVGKSHYPNVADFIEEVREMGLSRRLPKSFPFEKVDGQTMIAIVHERGHIENVDEYERFGGNEYWKGPCPLNKSEHLDEGYGGMCAGYWWTDIADRKVEEGMIQMPSFSYRAVERPAGVEPEYKPAIVAIFPMSRLAVVRDDEGGLHEDAFGKAQKAGLPVALVEE